MEWFMKDREDNHTVCPAQLWKKVRESKKELGITEKLGKNWRWAFKQRHGICFKRQKRSITLMVAEAIDRICGFHTFTQAFRGPQQVTVVGNFDETPLSFTGEFCRMIATLVADGEDCTIQWSSMLLQMT